MIVDIEREDLQKGLLGLVVAVVEILAETLELQALRRMDGGSLTEAEVDRLGEALMDLRLAIDRLKRDIGVTEAVRAVRDSLDRAVAGVLDSTEAVHGAAG